jgi:hypothetical protein
MIINNLKFSISIVIAFIVFTIIGTLSHEFGHIAVAKCFGFETTLHYGSMEYFKKGKNEFKKDKLFKELITIYDEFSNEISHNLEYEKKERFLELQNILDNKYPDIAKEPSREEEIKRFFITLGGPIQTLLTSFFGLFVLGFRDSKNKVSFQFLDWFAVFLSLFALREVFNFVTAIIKYIIFSKSDFYGDEFEISRYLEYNQWLIPVLTFILGLSISLYVIYKIIPFKYRFPFVISGFVGGCLGFAIWFGFLGRLLFILD